MYLFELKDKQGSSPGPEYLWLMQMRWTHPVLVSQLYRCCPLALRARSVGIRVIQNSTASSLAADGASVASGLDDNHSHSMKGVSDLVFLFLFWIEQLDDPWKNPRGLRS